MQDTQPLLAVTNVTHVTHMTTHYRVLLSVTCADLAVSSVLFLLYAGSESSAPVDLLLLSVFRTVLLAAMLAGLRFRTPPATTFVSLLLLAVRSHDAVSLLGRVFLLASFLLAWLELAVFVHAQLCFGSGCWTGHVIEQHQSQEQRQSQEQSQSQEQHQYQEQSQSHSQEQYQYQEQYQELYQSQEQHLHQQQYQEQYQTRTPAVSHSLPIKISAAIYRGSHGPSMSEMIADILRRVQDYSPTLVPPEHAAFGIPRIALAHANHVARHDILCSDATSKNSQAACRTLLATCTQAVGIQLKVISY